MNEKKTIASIELQISVDIENVIDTVGLIRTNEKVSFYLILFLL